MEFVANDRVLAALRSALTLPSIESELRDNLTALLETPAASVPLALLRRVAVAHRSADRGEFAWVHDICRGTSIYVPSPEQPKRVRTCVSYYNQGLRFMFLIVCVQSKEFDLYINKLKIKQENEVYDRMVAKSDCSILGANSIRNESANIREQFSIGSNVIAAMATGFVACYFVGKSIFWDNPAMVSLKQTLDI
jgi:hypothetical protein